MNRSFFISMGPGQSVFAGEEFFLPDGVPGCGFPGFLLPLFSKSKPPDFYDETSIPKLRSRPVACAGLLHGASGARRRILLYCRRRLGRRGRRTCLGLLAQLVVPHRRAAIRHVVGIFPASGAGAHARLFRPAFRARGGAVSGVVRALRNLPVPDGTDRCRRSPARRLPHPGQFRRRDRTPLVRLHAAGTLPVRPGCLAVDRDGFAMEGYLALWAFTLCIPYVHLVFPELLGECFWNDTPMLYYFSGFLGYMVLAAYLRRYHAAPRAWYKWGVALLVVAGISRRHGFSTHGWRRSGSSRTSNFRGASGRSTWPRCRSGCSCC